jgi:hypothetical protein
VTAPTLSDGWISRAACAGCAEHTSRDGADVALAVCGTCPVLLDCADWATTHRWLGPLVVAAWSAPRGPADAATPHPGTEWVLAQERTRSEATEGTPEPQEARARPRGLIPAPEGSGGPREAARGPSP